MRQDSNLRHPNSQVRLACTASQHRAQHGPAGGVRQDDHPAGRAIKKWVFHGIGKDPDAAGFQPASVMQGADRDESGHAISMVDVAQLVESRIVIPVVAGSSPVIHPSLNQRQIQKSVRIRLLYRSRFCLSEK